MTSLRLLSESDLIALQLSLDDVLALVEQSYLLQDGGLVDAPTKIGVHPERYKSFAHAMPAWIGGSQPALGTKWISYYPGNAEHGLPDSTGVIVLNDPHTGQPICIMEGMYITLMRTAACAAIVARRIIKAPQTLGLVGCGGLGSWSLKFLRHIFPSIKTVYVSSQRRESREAFAASTTSDHCAVQAVDHVGAALENSDIVVTSVPPYSSPPIKKNMLRPDAVFIPLDILNSWDPELATDFDCFMVDNTHSFPTLMQRKLGDDAKKIKNIHSTQDYVAQKLSITPQGRVFVGVCGIASVDISIASGMYRRAIDLARGGTFQMRKP